MSDCSFITNIHEKDKWVVPHQLLPFSLVMYGFDPKLVIILFYIWESFETLLMYCPGIIKREETTNSILSDPIEGFIGVFVAKIFLHNFQYLIINNNVKNNFMSLIDNIFHFILLSSIGVVYLDEIPDELEILYPIIIFILLIFLQYRLNNDINVFQVGYLFLLIYIIGYQAFLSIVEGFNSFLLSIIWVLFVLIIMFFYLNCCPITINNNHQNI